MTILALIVAMVLLPPGDALLLQEGTDMLRVDVQPKPVKTGNPVYPALARKAGIEGTVYVKALIDTAGMVSKLEILKSDNEILDQPSLIAAKEWRFTPARKGNAPVAVWITIPFRYKLSDEGKDSRTSSPPPHEGEALLKQTLEIIAGTGSPDRRPPVAPDAYVIDGATYVSLHDVLAGKTQGTHLREDAKRRSAFVKTTIAENGLSATVVIKTETATGGDARWHSVNWEKGKTGVWTIRHWHTSWNREP